MTLKYALATLIGFGLASPVIAQPPEVVARLGGVQKLGVATAKFASIKIYDAELYVPDGGQFDFSTPFALTLRYHRNFTAGILANATIREMARIEERPLDDLRPLEPEFQACFADVGAGDRFTGVGESKNKISFYRNGTKTCEMSAPDLRARFFNIWLGPETRDKKGSAKLKGRG